MKPVIAVGEDLIGQIGRGKEPVKRLAQIVDKLGPPLLSTGAVEKVLGGLEGPVGAGGAVTKMSTVEEQALAHGEPPVDESGQKSLSGLGGFGSEGCNSVPINRLVGCEAPVVASHVIPLEV